MKLIVGLGNPGSEYAATRHNIGFMALDAIARDAGVLTWQKKFQGEFAEARIGGEKVFLLKPMTYMNLSGQSVGELARFYKIEPGDIIVFHDELDLQPGKVRVKRGGGHAGHNGLKSLHAHVGEDFWRVRLGIGHPGVKHLVSNYVLGAFAKADAEWLEPLLTACAQEAPLLVKGEAKAFQSRLAEKINDAAQRSGKVKAREAKDDAAPPPPVFAPRREEKPLSPFEKLKGLLKKDPGE